MASLPRILTVDPSGSITQQVRGAIDLMDRLVVQVDVPSAAEALEELQRAPANAVISAWEPGDDMRGWELAAKIKQINPDTAIIILADIDDPELDEDMRAQSPFVYMQRPLDVAQFIRVLRAALNAEDIFEAAKAPASSGGSKAIAMGPVPAMNVDKAKGVIDALQQDLNSMAILLVTRDGQTLLERGTIGYIDRDELAQTLLPTIMSNIAMRDVVGGNVNLLQFFDGDEYDLFALSVGLHHIMVVIFDGALGARQFGAVNRFGRRSAEDLIALLGANAWIIQPPVQSEDKPDDAAIRRRPTKKKQTTQETEAVELERGSFPAEAQEAVKESTVDVPETVMPQMDAIPDEDFDLDAIFGADDLGDVDDLFSMDNLAELAKDQEASTKGTLSDDQARELGLI